MRDTTRAARRAACLLTGRTSTNLLMLDLSMTLPKAETSRRSPRGSASAATESGQRRSPTRLPFAFARDEQVLLDGSRLVAGPGATVAGLREAERRAGGRALELVEQTQAGFEAALSRFY